MCTLTFIPRNNGYYLAMNRDERIARGPATPPALIESGGLDVIYPRDIEGGTWIAASTRGVAFALLNWNHPEILRGKTRSRGSVIPSLISATSSRDAHAKLHQMDLRGVLPFRLIGIFPSEERAIEWRWEQTSLEQESLRWSPRQWCSSSLSDQKASFYREIAYARAQREEDAGSIAWLRRLHASHNADQYPFSVCVHRREVHTVSYAELICMPEKVQTNYLSGSPCRAEGSLHSLTIMRSHPRRSLLSCSRRVCRQ